MYLRSSRRGPDEASGSRYRKEGINICANKCGQSEEGQDLHRRSSKMDTSNMKIRKKRTTNSRELSCCAGLQTIALCVEYWKGSRSIQTSGLEPERLIKNWKPLVLIYQCIMTACWLTHELIPPFLDTMHTIFFLTVLVVPVRGFLAPCPTRAPSATNCEVILRHASSVHQSASQSPLE